MAFTDLVLYNTAEGRQECYVYSQAANGFFSPPPGAKVVWNTKTMGRVRFFDSAAFLADGTLIYEFYDDQHVVISGQVGIWVKRFGPNAAGIPGTVPYIDGYVTDSFDYIPAHKQWLLDHHRKTVSVYQFKMWLWQIQGVTIFNDIDAAIKDTYATEPLNKVRWEQRELMPYGGVIFNLALPFLNPISDFELFTLFESDLDAFYNEQNENDLS